jgi:hypothetical protein
VEQVLENLLAFQKQMIERLEANREANMNADQEWMLASLSSA